MNPFKADSYQVTLSDDSVDRKPQGPLAEVNVQTDEILKNSKTENLKKGTQLSNTSYSLDICKPCLLSTSFVSTMTIARTISRS